MKKILFLALCFVLTVFSVGCNATPANADEVEILFADQLIDGGYTGKHLKEFDLYAVIDYAIENEALIPDGKETKKLSVLESEAVMAKITARLEKETVGCDSFELRNTYRIYLENGDAAVLYTYSITYFESDVSDSDIRYGISRSIFVLVK